MPKVESDFALPDAVAIKPISIGPFRFSADWFLTELMRPPNTITFRGKVEKYDDVYRIRVRNSDGDSFVTEKGENESHFSAVSRLAFEIAAEKWSKKLPAPSLRPVTEGLSFLVKFAEEEHEPSLIKALDRFETAAKSIRYDPFVTFFAATTQHTVGQRHNDEKDVRHLEASLRRYDQIIGGSQVGDRSYVHAAKLGKLNVLLSLVSRLDKQCNRFYQHLRELFLLVIDSTETASEQELNTDFGEQKAKIYLSKRQRVLAQASSVLLGIYVGHLSQPVRDAGCREHDEYEDLGKRIEDLDALFQIWAKKSSKSGDDGKSKVQKIMALQSSRMARFYLHQNKHELAKNSLVKAVELYDPIKGDPNLAFVRGSMAYDYLRLARLAKENDEPQYQDHIENAAKELQSMTIGFNEWEASWAGLQLGELYYSMGEPERAFEFLIDALESIHMKTSSSKDGQRDTVAALSVAKQVSSFLFSGGERKPIVALLRKAVSSDYSRDGVFLRTVLAELLSTGDENEKLEARDAIGDALYRVDKGDLWYGDHLSARVLVTAAIVEARIGGESRRRYLSEFKKRTWKYEKAIGKNLVDTLRMDLAILANATKDLERVKELCEGLSENYKQLLARQDKDNLIDESLALFSCFPSNR